MFVPWRDYCAALSTAYKVAQLLHLAIGWRWSLSQPFSVGQAFCEPAEFVLMIAMFLPHKPAFIYIGCLYLFFSQFPKQSINPAFKIFFGFFWCVCVCKRAYNAISWRWNTDVPWVLLSRWFLECERTSCRNSGHLYAWPDVLCLMGAQWEFSDTLSLLWLLQIMFSQWQELHREISRIGCEKKKKKEGARLRRYNGERQGEDRGYGQ